MLDSMRRQARALSREASVAGLQTALARAHHFLAAGRGARVEFMKVWIGNEMKPNVEGESFAKACGEKGELPVLVLCWPCQASG
jgi:hypothetical protein